ncbi:unnamed protein product [Brachionus calyciflorus]|uniref:Uncharacterized protein n=1 Tax=Brachionus calyciflorus TaxID=104777 RepID=A0A813M7L6_9BILA|nr:unnamed protein product [Brachionus calyciflorus]
MFNYKSTLTPSNSENFTNKFDKLAIDREEGLNDKKKLQKVSFIPKINSIDLPIIYNQKKCKNFTSHSFTNLTTKKSSKPIQSNLSVNSEKNESINKEIEKIIKYYPSILIRRQKKSNLPKSKSSYLIPKNRKSNNERKQVEKLSIDSNIYYGDLSKNL